MTTAIDVVRKTKKRFDDPSLYVNRELSWLSYNARVLAGATRLDVPLLERLRFLTYFASNLDEFVMIRVANLLEADEAGLDKRGPDDLTPAVQLDLLSTEIHRLMQRACETLQDHILPGLAEEGLSILSLKDLTKKDLAKIEDHFQNEVFPVLTPKTVDPTHPFPNLPNLSHNIVVCFHEADELEKSEFAIVEIPSVLDQLIEVGSVGSCRFVRLADVIRHFCPQLFRGLSVSETWEFRLTRDADLDLREPEVENLLSDVERELTTRTFRRVVRLEIEDTIEESVLAQLVVSIGIDERELYRLPAPFHVGSLRGLYGVRGFGHLKDPPFNPRLSPRMAERKSIFSIIREKDVLLHHPYESFSTVTELLREAAVDKNVLAIKLTLYRTSGDSVIIEALKRAAEERKSVTALVELKARFDETNNIRWARELEAAGVHVVYGIVGLKTHCKAALIVRRERSTTRRYVHLSTGNYNSITARVYTDLALMTADPEMGEDVSQLFNILTGYSARNIHSILDGRVERPKFHQLFVAPFELVGRFLGLIEDEIRFHKETGDGLIQAKVNALQEPSIIRALYQASCAGVKIRLIVRGICSLKPGIPGVSENIEVSSIVDRFLEHPRVFHFRHGGADLVYVSSADWMPRNLFRRIEQMFPVRDPDLRKRILEEILPIGLADTATSWEMKPDGTYVEAEPTDGEAPFRSQTHFIELAREAGQKSIPYERALRETRRAGKQRRKRKKS